MTRNRKANGMLKPTHSRHTVASVLLLAMLATTLGACSNDSGTEAPSTTTTTTTTPPATGTTVPAPPVAPTKKSINPTGGNLFTPSVKAPGPQTAAPGNLPGNN